MNTDSFLFPLVLMLAGLTLYYRRSDKNWRFASIAVLAITLICAIWSTQWAGVVGVLAYVLLITLPGSLYAIMNRSETPAQYKRAVHLSYIVQATQPFHDWKALRDQYRVLWLQSIGRTPESDQIASRYLSGQSNIHTSIATAHFYATGDWVSAQRWLDQHAAQIDINPHLLWLQLRVWSDAGNVEALVLKVQQILPQLKLAREKRNCLFCVAMAFAATGQVGKLTRMIEMLRPFKPFQHMLFHVVALRAAGLNAQARHILNALAGDRADGFTAWRAKQLLAMPDLQTHPPLSPETQAALAEIELEIEQQIALKQAEQRSARPPATTGLIIANSTIYFLSWLPTFIPIILSLLASLDLISYDSWMGYDDGDAVTSWLYLVYAQGSLIPASVLYLGQWWRVFTMMFIHAGLLHLGFNMLALRWLGKEVERKIGSGSMLAIYLIIGTLTGVGLVLLAQLRIIPLDIPIVGASGAILGLLGIVLGWRVAAWQRDKSKRRLANLRDFAIILVAQFTLDWFVPQVSFAGHALGAGIGFIAGLLTARLKEIE